MNGFDSPQLEALAFSYLTHGLLVAVHNLWTWVAVVTAALSFWRIRVRALSPATAVVAVVKDSTHSTQVEHIPAPAPSTPAPSNNPETTAPESLNGVTARRRRKFSMKFQDETIVNGDEPLKLRTERRDGEWWGRWEKMLRTKQGRNSWYQYQDLTPINGSVVRLWDDFEWGSRYSVVR